MSLEYEKVMEVENKIYHTVSRFGYFTRASRKWREIIPFYTQGESKKAEVILLLSKALKSGKL